MTAKYPKKLSKGDTIGVVCPSSAISEEDRELCRKFLEGMGYKVKLADNLTANLGGYMAGTGEVRGYWLNQMFADPEVDAILCARGGNGSTRVYEHLDLDIVRKNPKLFIGYSDITTYHLAFNQQCGLVTFHGPMCASNMIRDFDEQTAKSFFDAINGDEEFVYENPKGVPIEVLFRGKVTAPVVGGNLSLMCESIGTPFEMDARGKIMFIEELNEDMSQLERWMYHLKNAGKFDDCAGVILGQFTNIENREEGYGYIELCKDILRDFNKPFIYNVESGHGKPMMTIPFGCPCTLDTESDHKLVFKIERE